MSDPERIRIFRKVTESTRVHRGAGLVGRVLATGEAQSSNDVTVDATYVRSAAAMASGLHGGFAFPVLIGSEVVAVLEFYSVREEAPDARILDMMAHLGTQLGRVVERERARNLLERYTEKLKNLSLVDELTGLYNRRGFLERGRHELQIARRTARAATLVFVDMNGMKPINDILGHEEGDRALVDVARVLRSAFEDTAVVARLGGDEFVILTLESPADQTDAIRTKIVEKVRTFNCTSDRPYHLSLSVGVAVSGAGSSASVEELLTAADALMYDEKRLRKMRGTVSLMPVRKVVRG
jgi:diguanylate cyclase (GGDEF)-like protein